jgi:hypothetical protein
MPQASNFWEMTRILAEMGEAKDLDRAGDRGLQDGGLDRQVPESSGTVGLEVNESRVEIQLTTLTEGERLLGKIGYFNDISPEAFVFDEKKYAPSKRQLELSEWDRTNRHLPIEIDPGVINKPGQRSPGALKRVVEYTKFNNPRYVAAPGERVTMCNIAAWDWSRALQLHLPHWIGETEMSANMLYRWISHPQAGGIYGEGWQPVDSRAAQLLANRGIPVFALAENTTPGRHGHVALVFPVEDQSVGLTFASVSNGRWRGANGIKSLQNTFRRLTPTFFIHKVDFILHRDS